MRLRLGRYLRTLQHCLSICTYIHTYTHTHIHTYLCLYLCVNIYTYTCTYTYKHAHRAGTGHCRFPTGGPGEPRHRANLYVTWPLGPISRQLAQGSPAGVQIYTKTGLRRPFPSRWPREAPPPYKSIRKVASGAHFPAGGPGRARQRINLYQNWPPEAISQQMAQGSPATVQIYTKCGLWGSFPSKWLAGGPPAHCICERRR